jgi:pilus assembly protein CpaE
MSPSEPNRRHVLIIGSRLAAIAEQALPGSAFQVVPADGLDAPALLHSPVDLALIEADAADPARLAAVIGALAQMPQPPAAILVGAHLPTSLVRAMYKLKRSDVLEAPIGAAELARCAAILLADPSVQDAVQHRSQCWSIMSAVGGAGATTLAIEFAATLAGRTLGDKVGLFDLNLADGAASAYLGAAPNMHLADASEAPDRIDQALLDVFSLRVGGGFDLFACPRDPSAFARVSPVAVCRLLEVACQAYDWLIIDIPRLRQPWTLDVLAGSDEILVVSELTVPALLAARALSDELEGEIGDGRRPKLVVNRLANRAFGPAPSRAEAEKALGRKVDGAITSDWEAAACSANLGGPISHHRPRSKIVRDVTALVEELVAPGVVATVRANPIRLGRAS